MVKRGVSLVVFAFFVFVLMFNIFSFVSASEIDSEIAKITNYAEEYETGNVNYAQLMVYLSDARQKMNEKMGVVSKEDGGILKEEQLRSVLGEPTEKQGRVWNEREMKEIRVEKDVPVWRKIIFDGNKIKIWLNAWPSVFNKNGNDDIIYRLDIRTEFKKEKTDSGGDISSGINEIKILAENYNVNPSNENANELAKKSVDVEKRFQDIIKEGREKCEELLSRVLGSENKRQEQKTIVQEIDFYRGEDFDVIMRLEMCDECEWHWTNLDFWIQGNGAFKQPKETKMEKPDMNSGRTSEDYKREIRNIVSEIKSAFERGDINSAYALKGKLMQYNEAWNQMSNDAWKEADKVFNEKNNQIKNMENSPERNDPYYWLKQEQEKRKMVQEISDRNYNERKQFYIELVSEYPKKEYVFRQTEFEKRLVEIFGEFKQEQCGNNQDDNNNGNIDCADEQCNGKICGEGEVEIQIGNETKKENQKLFCIMKECKAREEVKSASEGICGNNICEGNEIESCNNDCVQCKSYDAINCTGKVIFKGKDEIGCPLEPICIEETLSCSQNSDCSQPLCGKAECNEGRCEVSTLEECREAECSEGQEKILKCNDGNEIISEKCFDGVWKDTGIECAVSGGGRDGNESDSGVVEEVIVDGGAGNECVVKEDCGGIDDVCSNGRCVAIPRAEKTEDVNPQIEQPQKEQQEQIQSEQPQKEQQEQKQEGNNGQEGQGEQGEQTEQQEQIINDVPVSEIQEEVSESTESSETQGVTGNIIRMFSNAGNKVTGFVITAFDVEEGESGGDSGGSEGNSGSGESGGSSDSGSGDSDSSEGSEGNYNEGQQPQSPQQGQPPQDGEFREGEFREGEFREGQPPAGEFKDDRNMDDERREEDKGREEERQRNDEQRRQEDEKRRNEECSKNCNDNCERSVIVPCVQKCVFDSKCGINCDSEMESCKGTCKEEKDITGCQNDCREKCIKGEGFQMEKSEEMNKFEKAVFKAGGQCRVSEERKEGGLWFDGWGEPFEGIRYLKQEYYNEGSNDWCKNELENYIQQRKEFEKSMNDEFLRWFFEKYMANSAEDWEGHISGIYELYWKDVELSREMARTMECSEINNMPEFNMINIKYESEYGKVEFWEEMKNVKMPEFGNREMNVVSPYMKVWIFPPKEFIKYEMKKAMKEHEFPGSGDEKVERTNEGGPTEEEKEHIKQDRGLMGLIKGMSEKYNGNVDVSVQFKDYNTSETVFNIYVQINENDIIKMKPMLLEEMPEQDVNIEIDFEKVYELISESEKEMGGERIESPPWDKKFSPMGKVKEIKNGVEMYFKVKGIINSATITPESSEKDAKKLINEFFSMMMKEGMNGDKQEDNQGQEGQGKGDNNNNNKDNKGLTGNVILEGYQPF